MNTTVMPDASWTPDAVDVVRRACDHYGGIATWRRLKRVRLIPGRLSGLIPWMKGYGRTFDFTGPFEIEPHARRARFLRYPEEGQVGVFDDGSVSIERHDGGGVLMLSRNHRQRFRGLSKNRRWTPADALYFFGYALTHYHSLPFTLMDGRLLSKALAGRRGDRSIALQVELPRSLPTHCRRQTFYFRESGELVRHDYHAEILGFWARGAHFWNRQTPFNGIPIALERHVVARLGSIASPVPALHATFQSAEVELE